MTRGEAIEILSRPKSMKGVPTEVLTAHTMAIKALEQESRKGEWRRMSNLPEQLDYRYKCSCCGNVVHHISRIDLYTFNSWCGRCGSDNGRNIEVEL